MELSPNRENIALIMQKLINDEIERSKVAAWAQKFYLDDNFFVNDEQIYTALERLSSVDLVGLDQPYLYTPEDFKSWLYELDNI